MRETMQYVQARDMLLSLAAPVGEESADLENCAGRVLARNLSAAQNVPPFDRSPYDGYALRAGDTAAAGPERPVTLEILEEVPAGAVPTKTVTPGTATKILTGAPIPPGADAVVMYEKTHFDARRVTLFAPVAAGANIVKAGEDVRAGQVLAEAGTVIDAGLMGALASQGIGRPWVYRVPRVGFIATGDEVAEPGGALKSGAIYNSNRYAIAAVLEKNGCETDYLGLAGDRTESIAALIDRGLARCDAVLLTGGVSAGDYDLTPAAMERAGVKLLTRGVKLKPGMACAYGEKDGKLVLGLSGNPASALTNLYAVVLPALNRLRGLREPIPREITVALARDFDKESKQTRVLRGRLDLSDGTARIRLLGGQGNVMLASLIGCDAMAVVPAGSGALAAGTELKGFLI